MNGAIVTLTGQSGIGKTTLAGNCLLRSKYFRMIPSNTTREARPSDLPNEYKYRSQERFEALQKKGDFLWSKNHSGIWYGTFAHSILKATMECKLGYIGIMILVPEVIPQLRKFLSRITDLQLHIPIFLEVSDPSALYERMLQRGDDPIEVERRMHEEAAWPQEARKSGIPYHYVNADLNAKEVTRSVLSLFPQLRTS